MIKLMFLLIKLWFKLVILLAGLLAGELGGVLVGEILMRVREITAGQDDRQPPAKTQASSRQGVVMAGPDPKPDAGQPDTARSGRRSFADRELCWPRRPLNSARPVWRTDPRAQPPSGARPIAER